MYNAHRCPKDVIKTSRLLCLLGEQPHTINLKQKTLKKVTINKNQQQYWEKGDDSEPSKQTQKKTS